MTSPEPPSVTVSRPPVAPRIVRRAAQAGLRSVMKKAQAVMKKPDNLPFGTCP